jgi:hypothetical protein
MRHQAHAPKAGSRDRRRYFGDASFARSFDPCGSIPTMLPAPKTSVGGAFGSASRSGKPAQAGRTGTGAFRADVARLAARHRFRKEEGVARKRRKEVEASVPARIEELGFAARRSNAVAEVGRRRLVSNKLGKRAPKRAAGPSERRPRSAGSKAGDTASGRVGRKDDSRVGLTGEITGEDRRRPRVARDRHPAAFTSPKAVGRSRGRGRNSHRILRRALTDRRHPGSSRDAAFHGTTSTVV